MAIRVERVAGPGRVNAGELASFVVRVMEGEVPIGGREVVWQSSRAGGLARRWSMVGASRTDCEGLARLEWRAPGGTGSNDAWMARASVLVE